MPAVSKPPKSRRPRRTPPTIDLKAASSTVTPLDPPAADSPSGSGTKAQGGAPKAAAPPPPKAAEAPPVETVVGSSDVTRPAVPDAPTAGASPAGVNGGAATRRSRVYGSAGAGEDGVTGGAAPAERDLGGADTSAPASLDAPASHEPDERPTAGRVPNLPPLPGREDSGSRATDAPARRGLGLGSLLGAGVVGGLVGAGATFLAAPFLNPAPRPDPRIAVLEERLGAVPPRDQIGSLERRLSALEGEQTGVNERLRAAQGSAERGLARAEEALNRPAAPPPGDGQPATGAAPVVPGTALAELTARLEALEGRARQQDATLAAPPSADAPPAGTPLAGVPDERLAALARQVDALENAVRERGPAQDVAASVEPRLAEQDRRLGEIGNRLGGIETSARERAQELSSALGGLRDSVGRLEQSAQSLQGVVQPLPEAVQNLERRLGEQDGRLAELSRAIETAGGRLDALGQQLQAQDGRLGALGQQLQGQDGRLAEIGQRLGAQDGRVAEIGQQARAQDERLAALQGGLQSQDARLTDLARQFADRDPAPVLRVVAADRVAGALREGAPYGPALDALRRLGADPAPLQALEPFAGSGAPTAAALANEFKPLGERMIREGRPAPASFTDRLWRMADEVVTVRPVGEATGTDVESLIARIEAALRRGAITEAASAFDALPETARAPAEAFGRKLRERAAAETAASQVSAGALSALSAPR